MFIKIHITHIGNNLHDMHSTIAMSQQRTKQCELSICKAQVNKFILVVENTKHQYLVLYTSIKFSNGQFVRKKFLVFAFIQSIFTLEKFWMEIYQKYFDLQEE